MKINTITNLNKKSQLVMNFEKTYLVTKTDNERLGKYKLDLVVL